MANYLLEMQLAEDLTFTEIRFISSALKQGRTIIGYITPKGSSVDKRMGPQKFQFLTINDDQAEIIWLPPSRDGKPYSQEEIAGLKPDQKALLRSKEYEDVNEPRVVAEQQYSLQDLQVIDPTDDSWDDESGILARKAWKRKSRDVEEDAEGVSTLQLIFKDFPAEHDGSLDAYYDLERFTKEIADDIEIERDKKIITIKGKQMDLDEIEDFVYSSRGGPSMAKTYFEAYEVGTDAYRKHATKLTPGQKHKGKEEPEYNGDIEETGYTLTRQEYAEEVAKIKPLPTDIFYVKNDIEVIRNPSERQQRSMTADARRQIVSNPLNDPLLRSTNDKRGNTWIWKAHEGMHSYIEPTIEARERVKVNQNNRIPTHREVVRDAVRSGLTVPKKVQEEYPEYKKFFVEATKTIKVGEDSIGAENTTYAVVKNRMIVSLGEKDKMLALAKNKGGRVWVISDNKKIGDLVESTKLEERPKNESLEFDGVESDGEAEEMLDRIKQRAADRKDAAEIDRPERLTKVRPATRKILEKRALRAARALVFKRLSNGKSKSELLFADRLKIEKTNGR